MNKLLKVTDKIESILLLGILFLYPLFVTTFFSNIFDASKLLLISVGLGIITIIKVVKLFSKNSFEVNIGKYDIFMLLFALLFLISGIFASYNKVDAFFLPGNAAFAIFAVILYFFINQRDYAFKSTATLTLIASVFILCVYQILNFVGVINLIPFIPEVMKSKVFTPIGNILSLIIVSVGVLPYLIKRVMSKDDLPERVLSGLVSLIVVVAISISLYMSIFGKDTSVTILNFKHGFPIAIDSLKENPLLGVGPSYFTYAFNRFRPISFNNLPYWDVKFLQSTSQFLTIFSEVGILALVAFGLLGYLLYKNRDIKSPLFIALPILFLSVLFLPLSFSSLPIIFSFFALSNSTQSHKMGYFIKKIPQTLIGVPIVAVVFILSYLYGRAFYAEFVFFEGIKKLNNNEVVLAYELTNKAVALNPYSDKLHQFSSGLNITLAENLAKKENLTDADKTTISGLIQQAIREGRAAVAVNPKKSYNWEGLSDIYRGIMAFAKGADNFSIQTLNQAIALDPINPSLRIKLGGLYYSLNKYEEAIDVLKLAVLAKSNHPNIRYNLALAYKANKQIDKAKEQMEIVLKLVDPNSKDYELAKNELDSLNTKKDENLDIEAETLIEPEPTPVPAIEPQIDLPASEETPSEVQTSGPAEN